MIFTRWPWSKALCSVALRQELNVSLDDEAGRTECHRNLKHSGLGSDLTLQRVLHRPRCLGSTTLVLAARMQD